MNINEIKNKLRNYGVKGYSKLNKEELMNLLNKYESKSKEYEESLISPMNIIRDINKKYPAMYDYIIRIYDADGIAYIYDIDDKIHKWTGIATMSMETYSIDKLLKKGNVTVIVFTSVSKQAPRGGLHYKDIDREVFRKVISLKSKQKIIEPKKSISGNKVRNDIVKLLEELEYELDRFGNYKKQKGDRIYRYKFSDKAFREEVKKEGEKLWTHVGGGYYKDFQVDFEKKRIVKRRE